MVRISNGNCESDLDGYDVQKNLVIVSDLEVSENIPIKITSLDITTTTEEGSSVQVMIFSHDNDLSAHSNLLQTFRERDNQLAELIREKATPADIPTKLSELTDDSTTTPIDCATTLQDLTSSIDELNYCSGVTSSIQEQLNSKMPNSMEGLNALAKTTIVNLLMPNWADATSYANNTTVHTAPSDGYVDISYGVNSRGVRGSFKINNIEVAAAYSSSSYMSKVTGFFPVNKNDTFQITATGFNDGVFPFIYKFIPCKGV